MVIIIFTTKKDICPKSIDRRSLKARKIERMRYWDWILWLRILGKSLRQTNAFKQFHQRYSFSTNFLTLLSNCPKINTQQPTDLQLSLTWLNYANPKAHHSDIIPIPTQPSKNSIKMKTTQGINHIINSKFQI